MIERVAALMREAADTVILPLFRQLAAHEIYEKSPGEVVTAADGAAERLLTDGLPALLPGSLVVGEEAVAADPTVLDRLSATEPVWLVDPLDGTRNFAAGREPFAVMVALLRGGATVAAWIYDPVGRSLAVAEAGSGAFVDGQRVQVDGRRPPAAELRGAVLTRYLPNTFRVAVEARLGAIGALLPGFYCAGREYPAIVAGAQDFALFWRTLPWDHAPGALFALEAGAAVRRFDGSAYQPADGRTGLLVAHNAAVWETAAQALLNGGAPK